MAIFDFLGKILDLNEREVTKLKPLVQSINELENEFKKLSNEDLQAKTADLKLRLERDEVVDDVLSEAFAAVREASDRTLGLRHFDVQLLAGIAFLQGK